MENDFAKLKSKYPKLYSRLTYIECDDGWSKLLDTVSHILENMIESLPYEIQGAYYATQVKSKFASLRFYMSNYTKEMHGAILMAENCSVLFCEKCGNMASVRNINGHIITLCDSDFNKLTVVAK